MDWTKSPPFEPYIWSFSWKSISVRCTSQHKGRFLSLLALHHNFNLQKHLKQFLMWKTERLTRPPSSSWARGCSLWAEMHVLIAYHGLFSMQKEIVMHVLWSEQIKKNAATVLNAQRVFLCRSDSKMSTSLKGLHACVMYGFDHVVSCWCRQQVSTVEFETQPVSLCFSLQDQTALLSLSWYACSLQWLPSVSHSSHCCGNEKKDVTGTSAHCTHWPYQQTQRQHIHA